MRRSKELTVNYHAHYETSFAGRHRFQAICRSPREADHDAAVALAELAGGNCVDIVLSGKWCAGVAVVVSGSLEQDWAIRIRLSEAELKLVCSV